MLVSIPSARATVTLTERPNSRVPSAKAIRVYDYSNTVVIDIYLKVDVGVSL